MQIHNDNSIKALVCFCCAQTYVSHSKMEQVIMNEGSFGSGHFDVVFPPDSSEIQFYPAKVLALQTPKSMANNFSEKQFSKNFADKEDVLQRPLAEATFLRHNDWEWRCRFTYPPNCKKHGDNPSENLICCPEDVEHCPACKARNAKSVT